ncbi:PTS sugar transporter subunit IIB [Cryobacterium melibiosiphilum]|uniref:PTS sugar transporter subunit IIB n=1 Tax=Cryobacterium melibiosiphilum TaxID=995039 RepID=A0A3A5ME91_9MICO|nr:PTS sugar transporter subunit IIB [Cryobacterium melibiosiphilum]RJT87772.1 PTS sugar transporter subunit IIB [Cryobacterium melibiosiphilum]
MKIVVMCGLGLGTSEILKVNAERALERLSIDADVMATDVAGVQSAARDAQVILTSSELVGAIGRTNADVIVIDNFFDVDEVAAKLETALG